MQSVILILYYMTALLNQFFQDSWLLLSYVMQWNLLLKKEKTLINNESSNTVLAVSIDDLIHV